MMRIRAAALSTATLLAAGVGIASPGSGTASASCALPTFGPGSEYHPNIDPARFTADVTNSFFPLHPGTTYVYSGVKDAKNAIDVVTPSARTAVIDGVTTREVNDRLMLDGVLSERTTDYYAQDICGNVWYFGEDTAELDSAGHVIDTSGSWHAGVKGAKPGVYMQAKPQVGRTFRQEWFRGQAEDVFKAVSRDAEITVPFGSFDDALSTRETSALEPGILDKKVYVEGLGEVVEAALRGPTERLELVDVLR